jgi:hypothetical protein
MSITTPEALTRAVQDTPLRVALAGRRGRHYDETLAAVCHSHGKRLGRAGAALPDWLPTAPRWARQAMVAGHAEAAPPGDGRPD